jgi:hypothetical protein
VAWKVRQGRFLTFVALLKSPLGRRFVLDGDFTGNHSALGNNANLAQCCMRRPGRNKRATAAQACGETDSKQENAATEAAALYMTTSELRS